MLISCFLDSIFKERLVHNPLQNATNELYVSTKILVFSSTSPNFIVQRAIITPKVIVKEEALVIEKASEEVEGGFQLLYLIIRELKSHMTC